MPGLIGERVREARERMNLTQDAFAKLLGVSRSYISVVEGGHTGVSVDQLAAIADSLAIEPGSLMPTLARFRAAKRAGVADEKK